MEERECYPGEARHLPNTPSIITEDVYEQIDNQQWRPDEQDVSEPGSSVTLPHSTNCSGATENKVPLDQSMNQQPPPIDEVDYDQVDQPVKQLEEKTSEALPPEDAFDSDNSCYEDMNASSKSKGQARQQRVKNPVNIGKQDTESREHGDHVTESNNRYEALHIVNSPESEYRDLHNYGNTGYQSQSQYESCT
jgi:hypothetical protein